MTEYGPGLFPTSALVPSGRYRLTLAPVSVLSFVFDFASQAKGIWTELPSTGLAYSISPAPEGEGNVAVLDVRTMTTGIAGHTVGELVARVAGLRSAVEVVSIRALEARELSAETAPKARAQAAAAARALGAGSPFATLFGQARSFLLLLAGVAILVLVALAVAKREVGA